MDTWNTLHFAKLKWALLKSKLLNFRFEMEHIKNSIIFAQYYKY